MATIRALVLAIAVAVVVGWLIALHSPPPRYIYIDRPTSPTMPLQCQGCWGGGLSQPVDRSQSEKQRRDYGSFELGSFGGIPSSWRSRPNGNAKAWAAIPEMV
jgi:hypothetical protein